jgi:hypothetical protein
MAQPSLKEIVDFIYSGMTRDDREVICDALREAGKISQHRAALQFHPGSRVQWESTRFGFLVKGTVEKINRTTVLVLEDGGGNRRWKVSPGLLSPQ